MAAKKLRNDVDSLRKDIGSLAEAVWALRDQVSFQSAAAAAVANPTLPRANGTAAAAEGLPAGTVVSRGVALDPSTAREYRWEFEGPVETVLGIEDEGTARVLAAIGHRQRLAILKMLLSAPSTAADMVASLDLGTTGAAYHHLNVLQAADLVTQAQRGVFSVPPHRVAALIAMFAGLHAATSTVVSDPVDGASAGDDATPAPDDAAGEAPSGKGRKKKA